MSGCCSGTMRAWLVVMPDPNYEGDIVELIEVEAGRIPASKFHRSEHDWFMEDHWDGTGACFWDEDDLPVPGEYVVSFHIEGEWMHGSNGDDYDEQLIVEKVEAADLGAFSLAREFKGTMGSEEQSDEKKDRLVGASEADEADFLPDYSRKCVVCGATPVLPCTDMCGPCTFGEAETLDGNW
ncbi:MAG: hypothetical protein WC683_01030 [bacterium]